MDENISPKEVLAKLLEDLAERDSRVLPNGLLNQIQHDFDQAFSRRHVDHSAIYPDGESAPCDCTLGEGHATAAAVFEEDLNRKNNETQEKGDQ